MPCLALLGEPGIGKTRALLDMVEATRSQAAGPGDLVLHVNLAGVSSDSGLIRRIFEDTTFTRWEAGQGVLYLFLDSLDEALAEVHTLSEFLLQELRRLDRERLRLRIACRTAEWPDRLEMGLPELFGDPGYSALELAPLRRRDVEQAATIEGIEPDAFISELVARHVVPFAISPVTLRFLLNLYREDQEFPGSRTELYRRGCLLLAAERERERERRGGAPAYDRLAIAERVAAVLMFAARDAVWTGVESGAIPETTVTLPELVGGEEGAGADVVAAPMRVIVTEESLRDALGTALFSARGREALGFAHQTYAEFLAARYVVNRNVSPEQLMSILTAQADPHGKIVPQLHEVAAWLAELDSTYFDLILRKDPIVLLRTDVLLSSDEDRRTLADEVLRLAEEEQLRLPSRGTFRKLAHPGIDAQLESVIVDRTRSRLVRRMAIDIAEEASGAGMAGVLLSVALDSEEEHSIRIGAAIGAAALGDDDIKNHLRPLLTLPADEDPDDELKGSVLHALWPSLLALDEMLAVLSPPRRPELIGLYSMFLARTAVATLDVAQLPRMLEWGAAQPHQERVGPFDDLIDRVIVRAFENVRETGVAEALASLTATFLPVHHRLLTGSESGLLRDRMLADVDGRRLLLTALIPYVSAGTLQAVELDIGQEPFLVQDDVLFLVELLDRIEESEREAVASLIERLFYVQTPYIELLLEAAERHRVLGQLLEPWLAPIRLDSPRAHELRERYERVREYEARREQSAELTPPIAERVEDLLLRVEGGDTHAWWPLTVELSRDPATPRLVNHLTSDVRTSSVWKGASSQLRQRILSAAARYVEDGDPHTDDWFGEPRIAYAAVAGYRALRVLAEESPGQLRFLGSSTWQRWAATVLGFPTTGEGADAAAQSALITRAHEVVADEVRARIEQLIQAETREDRHLFVLRKISELEDEKLDEIVADTLRTATRHEPATELIDFLLDRGSSIGIEVVRTLARPPLPREEEPRVFAVHAASALLSRDADAQIEIWAYLEGDDDYREAVLPALALEERRGERRAARAFTEHQLGQLFSWMARRYPYAEDRTFTGAHFVGDEELIERWRDSLLNELEGRGTEQACEVLRGLEKEFSELPWLRGVVARAEDNMRRTTWVHPIPRDLIQMLLQPQLRFVESGDQLLDVLIEALERAQQELQGETPAVIDLWNDLRRNQQGDRFWRPKSEPELSDWIARFLRRDLDGRRVVVNREVEVRRAAGAALGDRTDVDVVAVSSDPDRPKNLHAVIEVKGCWNADLETALQEQLVERYLEPSGSRHGVYAVGLFASERWDPHDRRRQRCAQMDKSSLTNMLQAQAEAITSSSRFNIRSYVLELALP